MSQPQLIDLSHTIVSGMAQWPGDKQPLKVHRRSLHGPDSHLSSSLEFGCHVGTHIDAPLHFLDGQPGLAELPLARFWGAAVVVRCGDGVETGPLAEDLLDDLDLKNVDFVLFDTGWARHWGSELYYRRWSYLSPELASRLTTAGLKGVGLDTPSLDPFGGRTAHDICAPAGLINIENLANLPALPDRGFVLQAIPLKLDGTEASPVRAVAILEN